MDTLSSCPHFVYELVDPRDNSIFYVGITVNLYGRYKQHMHCDRANPQKDQRIQEILAAGHLPVMRTIERIGSFELALGRESYWIQSYLQQGISLLNLASVPALFRSPNASKFGRRSKYEQIREIVLYRHTHGTLPDGLSADMREHYEFHYFTRPKRTEAGNPKKYAQHKRSYERGRKWIADLFDSDKPASEAG